ncbi:MAG TPA: VWA domain-containing protein [Candidatus Acidoferrum sp.]|nr:VWA domain-containing protein [Candidatus Acidoferrum sp.]
MNAGRRLLEAKKRKWLAIALGAAGIAALSAGSWAAKGQEPQIKVKVNLVNVSFVARDERGALVDNLTQDDVEILEDAVPQTISYFARSADVPLTLGLIVDASGSQDHFSKQHKSDLEVFFKDVLGPKDRVFLVGFGNHIRLVSDFSNSGASLLDDWKRYDKDTGKFPEIGPKEDRDLGTAFYDSIFYSITEKLARETGRRALLLFSDGEDNSSSHNMMTTIEMAQAENVLLYAIRYTEKEHGKLTARNKYGISVMERVARETGGAAIDAETTDPHTYFRKIAEELRTSYEIGYYPKDPLKDDTFRKIVIRPKREGITIRAKTGYFASKQ